MTTTITRDELKAQIARGDDISIVEALPPLYYQEGRLPGALNLPHDAVDALAPTLLPDKAQKIVVYCSNTACQNSGIAANRLRALGYTDVRTYAEGKQDWIEAGLPTESGVPGAPLSRPRARHPTPGAASPPASGHATHERTTTT